MKKVFLEILQNLQENTCVRVSFLIVTCLRPATLLKKRLWTGIFLCEISKNIFSNRTPLVAASLSPPLLS